MKFGKRTTVRTISAFVAVFIVGMAFSQSLPAHIAEADIYLAY